MNQSPFWLPLMIWLFAGPHVSASVRYVDVSGTNAAPPYTSWSTAATNIQDAIDAATAGDHILVTNGVYQTGSRANTRVVVDKALAIQSANGAEMTVINGDGNIGCVSLVDGASINGFTLTNGLRGVSCQSTNALVLNCLIVNCRASQGGGAFSGTLNNCVLRGNSTFTPVSSYFGGGGACFSMLNNCTLSSNTSAALGGGALACTLNNCTLAGNSAVIGGGAMDSRLVNCLLVGNSANGNIGWNSQFGIAFGGGGAAGTWLVNCTMVGNSAATAANGAGGAESCRLTNCVVYYNTGRVDHEYRNSTLVYSCTTPLPTGSGNITNSPFFIDQANGNLRLHSSSPCINAANNAYVTSPVDLDGQERIVGGTVDMGAYEWVAVPTHYVSLTNTHPISPYLSWSTAATNIQDAVNVAQVGHTVLVTNGVYQTGGSSRARVAVTRGITVRSVNGPAMTTIVGYQVPGTTNGDAAIRCVFLNSGARLAGFTLTNGATRYYYPEDYTSGSGGGVYCESTMAVVSNCVLTGNAAAYRGGGSFSGTLTNCTLEGNWARDHGGGASSGILKNCVLTNNSADFGGGAASDRYDPEGGGRYCSLYHCTLARNRAAYLGGGAYSDGPSDVFLEACTIGGNSSGYAGGGVYNGTLYNCIITDNTASAEGGGAAGAYYEASPVIGCELNNCTLTGNSASFSGGGAFSARLKNCIIYYNTSSPLKENYDSCPVSYSCTTPLPQDGIGNITNAPLFINRAGGNLRLQSNSPCINSGLGAGGTDLDGKPRVAGGTVDIGAYEFQSPASIISYAWSQQYGFLTDGSADYTDADGDHLNNWQEWIAGSVPTDPLSALRLFNPSKNMSNIIVSWQSVSNRTYFLQRATNLSSASPFSFVAGNILGQGGTTSYTDTNAIGLSLFFYRVGIQP